MPNKLFLFPFFGLLIPVLIYLGSSKVSDVFLLQINPISEVHDEVRVQQSDTREKSSNRLVFVGDVLLARHVEQYIVTDGLDYPFKQSSAIFGDAEIVVGNFESAVLENHTKTPSYHTTFSVNQEYLPILRQAGFTHVSLANNHSLDYGEATYQYTKTALQNDGLLTLGHPEVVSSSSARLIQSGDYSIGVLALNLVFEIPDWSQVEMEINQLLQQSDFQIAYVHWGDEYILKHNKNQSIFAKKLIDAGIDAVIGHHPHVTQDIEVYADKPIFYSLGNYLFDQYFSVDVQQGLALVLALGSSTATYELIPVSSEGSWSQPHKMPSNQSSIFLKNLARRSDPRYTENINQGKLILPFNLATSS